MKTTFNLFIGVESLLNGIYLTYSATDLYNTIYFWTTRTLDFIYYFFNNSSASMGKFFPEMILWIWANTKLLKSLSFEKTAKVKALMGYPELTIRSVLDFVFKAQIDLAKGL